MPVWGFCFIFVSGARHASRKISVPGLDFLVRERTMSITLLPPGKFL